MTEIFVDEVLDKDELREIVSKGLKIIDSPKINDGIISFYINVKDSLLKNLIRYGTSKPSIGLWNLSWSMQYVWNSITGYG